MQVESFVSSFTAAAIVCHLIGDYVVQSDRMAVDKTSKSLWAALHAVTYTAPFLLITRSLPALLFIAGTHFVIDRWRLARYVCWAKNAVGGSYAPWSDCSATGYHKDRPAWLAVWLLIICDNTMHLCCNAVAMWRWP
jgi:membrane-bound metal-dependent hydrolase YbcI (DUF457 family)